MPAIGQDQTLRRATALQLSRCFIVAICDIQAARAQQYKSKYDDLRTAILEKRKVKAATAAAAASAGGAVKSPDAKAAAPPPIGNAQWSNDSQETKGGPGHGPDTDAGKDGG